MHPQGFHANCWRTVTGWLASFLSFYMNSGDPDPVPHIYTANILSTEPYFPSPPKFLSLTFLNLPFFPSICFPFWFIMLKVRHTEQSVLEMFCFLNFQIHIFHFININRSKTSPYKSKRKQQKHRNIQIY